MHPIDNMMQKINYGMLYMHVMEGVVSEGTNLILKKLDKHLHQGNKQLNGKPLQAMAMWNAGYSGSIRNTRAFSDEALTFTYKEYAQFPKHIIEQFAFSVFFQHEGRVMAAAPYIFHYWNLKEARVLLSSFFAKYEYKSWGTNLWTCHK